MNTARKTVNADIIQEKGYTGKGIGIAILDTGISPINDFLYPKNRIIAFKDFINNKTKPYDDNGHGTHVAGIAGSNGINSNGKYRGIAPDCNLIGVKVLNNEGKGNASDVLAGLQWIIDNKEKYNIKIANLSIGTNNTSSNDPLVKAVEKIWDSGIIVTIAAGNDGPKKYSISSPAISKKVITIGASDDNITANVWGNHLINFSGRGPTLECVIKPDVLAPGVNIVSCLSNNVSKQSNEVIEKNYFSLSGTSMSTPIVSGAIALLLEKYNNLQPDDVKLMLKKCCKNLYLPKNQQGWGLIDVYKLLSQEVCYARK
ncbi:S8 family peptidase [[Clostridium] colinum]|uniref:S8 family peptidase n=1 Tax=[Clostridium] colinum TaxID=36835 RepID=UPI002025328C|nr:S8 family peptidase [[Clostridium] colinum]